MFKKAFHMGGHGKKDNVDDIQPLGHGAHGEAPTAEPVAPQSRTETTAADMKQGPATTPTDGHKSVGTVIKDTFTSAPWSDTHDKTLEALTHAKVAHAKAMQAQASLKAASESKNKADLAQRHAQEVERELEQHRQGMDGIGTSKKDYEDARLALAEHTKNHDHHSRLAREAEEALAAKELEMKQLGPQREQHAKALAPLQSDHVAVGKMRGEAERRREALLRELAEIDEHLGPLRTREADLGKRLEEHQRVGADHEKRFAALAEEQRLLRTRAEESRRGLEPHATNLKNAHALVGTKESAYAKAQKAHEAAKERMPILEKQVEEARREAKESAAIAAKHASAFEKLKKEAEAEDAKKSHLWEEARKTGHIEEDGASKQELHKLADRFHTVLNHPIDTTTLRGDGITAEIHEAAAKITGRSADGAADPARDTVAPKTPERVGNTEGVRAPPMAEPYTGAKMTDDNANNAPLPKPFESSRATTAAEPTTTTTTKPGRILTPPHTGTTTGFREE
ncbi:hypothetical protein WJX75_007694 [Coccomyxa subellipsoidea]|uniref:Uncharacterized protein n=1 Tax=Coccomyxa subellipsoidea TaxID=248742 RepID=A0ABR2Z510_9CHLO